ncbi:O-antigen ligase [Alkalibacillus salilacus]|uniref:O-antigen ligase n=2 Tax=Alkalibacillus salilacus TaxID=284582 RepID=A0ABT9VI89_9BACI|nr:O-antigen ligase [Alkalibacillus salilacus]
MNVNLHIQHLNKLVLILILTFMPINLLSVTDLANDIQKIGETTTDLTFYLSVIFLVTFFFLQKQSIKSITQKYGFLYAVIGSLIVLYTISYLNHQDQTQFSTLLTFILTLTTLLTFAKVRWNPKMITFIGYGASMIIMVLVIHWQILDQPTNRFQSVFWNPNGLGIITFCLLYFQIIALKYVDLIYKLLLGLTIILNIIMLYATTSRAVWLSLFIVMITWVCIKTFPKHIKYIFPIALGLIFVSVFLYTQLYNTTLGNWLNSLSHSLFSKNFFSGRSELWSELWGAIQTSLIWGHGIGTSASEVTPFSLPAHNQYLQFMLETGLIGLVLLCALLYTLWKLLISNANNYVTKWSMSFFIGILIYQSLEHSLFINNPWYSIIQWLIICIGITFTESDKRTNHKELN